MSTGGDDLLTAEERERIERFLCLFTAIEAELQTRLRMPATMPFNRLLRDLALVSITKRTHRFR